ncbi:major facilitator superfamily domain-containing protein 6-like isoform X2 [Uloborus diversus]|uniref:major facilitator superfamily domain-containing protein 6-like isoform X2 n=1 Tax=Uloborus diversus TaxID=327109 RepID=UPI002409F335|nr:major facilitator superfamily domain-containing protein 6-like isoform X2 [Uloborus diversus]
MELKNNMAEKCWRVNLNYLPIKAHYFFLFGAMGGSVPFMPVVAKGLGINATAVGLIYTVLPFCVFLSKPLFGYITDYFQNIKLIMITLVTVTTLSFICVLFIPPLYVDVAMSTRVHANCVNDNELNISPISNETCVTKHFKNSTCTLMNSKNCFVNAPDVLLGTLRTVETGELMNSNENFTLDYVLLEPTNLTIHFIFTPVAGNNTCKCSTQESLFMKCDTEFCSETEPQQEISVYKTYNFWLFTLLAVIAGTGSATSFCLSDAACCEVLKDDSKLYGRQRLWATIGWGIVTSLAGFLNDIVTGDASKTSYSSGFYLMLAFVIIDLIILSRVQMVKANMSLNICKDVGKIFSSYETVIFALGVYVSGALTGLIWNYQFWFLEDMGANQTLLGLTVAVQCLVAEVPFFFFAGYLIKVLGHFNCLFGTLFAFVLRLGLYYFLKNPWLTLPIEVLHGMTFAVFYAAMTSYASTKAPQGTEATMLGVFGGLFEGLGVATGSLLGGVGFDKLGGRRTFWTASIISLVCLPAFIVAYVVVRKFSSQAENKPEVPKYGTS